MSERILVLSSIAVAMTKGPTDPLFPRKLGLAARAAEVAQATWTRDRRAPDDDVLMLSTLVWRLGKAIRDSDPSMASASFDHLRFAVMIYAERKLSGSDLVEADG